jgi:hypothetical protein
MLGSMVQNGKLALCALALDKQLKSVDFPTLGNPTIPAFMYWLF